MADMQRLCPVVKYWSWAHFVRPWIEIVWPLKLYWQPSKGCGHAEGWTGFQNGIKVVFVPISRREKIVIPMKLFANITNIFFILFFIIF